MDISPGSNLLHYRLDEVVGEGGMGVVWRALDTTLGREVAIKVLPAVFASDPERLARFEREARLLASLAHPGIAAVHGLHEVPAAGAGTVHFLVMEFVPGEDLAARLARGPLPLDDAIAAGARIAEAIEAAHDHGVVHRDLKPANVKLAPDGSVKVLDFGLAKALAGDPGSSFADPSASPTLTSAGTLAGVILGTAAYMSPEQAKGRAVDRRADVWAFGVVLFEMLTGRRLFEGETVSESLASVLKDDVPWDRLPPATPPAVVRLLRRCLDRDPRTRLRDVGEARVALDGVSRGEGGDDGPATAVPARAARSGVPVALALAAAVVLAAAAAATAWYARPVPSPPLRRLSLAPPAGVQGPRLEAVLSPDGGSIAYVADRALWIQDLDGLTARRVPGGDDVTIAAWSPDGASVAFSTGRKLWRASRNGDTTLIGDAGGVVASRGGGLSWTDRDTIVFATGEDDLYEVPIGGGSPRSLLAPDLAIESDFHEPFALPGGRGVLYVVHRTPEGLDTLEVLAGGKRNVVLRGDGLQLSRPTYAPTGHLLFERSDSVEGIWAIRFDLERLETVGDAFLVAPDGSRPSVSEDGTLLYSNLARVGHHQLVRVDLEGKPLATVGPSVQHADNVAVSPDGTRLAVCVQENAASALWVHDLASGAASRLVFDAGCLSRRAGVSWSKDGASVLFGDIATSTVRRRRADGGDEVATLVDGVQPSLHPDGRTLLFSRESATTRADLWWVDLASGEEPKPFRVTDARESLPQISPRGDLVAYVSDETGTAEIYLESIPPGAGRWQASVGGGDFPHWVGDGSRLVYLRDESVVMEVSIGAAPLPVREPPRERFSVLEGRFGAEHGFDVTPDGASLVTVRLGEDTLWGGDLTLVTPWPR